MVSRLHLIYIYMWQYYCRTAQVDRGTRTSFGYVRYATTRRGLGLWLSSGPTTRDFVPHLRLVRMSQVVYVAPSFYDTTSSDAPSSSSRGLSFALSPLNNQAAVFVQPVCMTKSTTECKNAYPDNPCRVITYEIVRKILLLNRTSHSYVSTTLLPPRKTGDW